MPPLDNPKRERFCREYVKDLNATQAYIRAGYNAKNADANATRLMGNDGIAARIAELQEKVAQKLELTQERIVRELASLGFANMGDYVTVVGDGNVVNDFSDMTPEKWAAVQEITVDEYTEGGGEEARNVKRVKFKLADKRTALVDLGKHLGMWPNKAAESIAESLSDLIRASYGDKDG